MTALIIRFPREDANLVTARAIIYAPDAYTVAQKRDAIAYLSQHGDEMDRAYAENLLRLIEGPFDPIKSQAEIDAEVWPAKRRLFAIAATCGAVLTAIMIAVDPIRWVLP